MVVGMTWRGVDGSVVTYDQEDDDQEEGREDQDGFEGMLGGEEGDVEDQIGSGLEGDYAPDEGHDHFGLKIHIIYIN